MTAAETSVGVAEPPPAFDGGAEEPRDARRVAERVGAMLGEIGAIADPRIAERTEDLVSLLMQFYGAAIRRMMELADEAGLLEGELLDRFVSDELVSSLLVIHDLHPVDLGTRVQQALDKVRPYLGSHGGDVEIIAIEGDVVRLRMEGSCSSCPSSTVTLSYAIEKAILEAAPEISRIEADDVAPAGPAVGGQLIQLDARPGARTGNAALGIAAVEAAPPMRADWLLIDPAARPAPGGLSAVDLAGVPVLVCRSGDDLYAYRDRCPNCRSSLSAGHLTGAELRCPTCGHGFDVRLAGRSTGESALHLEPLPLLPDGESLRIAVPVPVSAVGVGTEHLAGSPAMASV